MTGPVILGRTQAKAMGYIQFPKIWQPHTLTTFPMLLENCVHTRLPYQRLYYTAKYKSPRRLNCKSLSTKLDL